MKEFIFRKDSNKYRNECKSCKKEIDKQWYLEDKEHIKKVKKEWYLENKNYIKKYQNQYEKQKRKIDPLYNLKRSLRSRLANALNCQDVKKSKRTMELIGCSIEFLKEHIEKQFKENMSWDNRSSFHIDHIKPCSSFNLLDEEEQRKCFHYTNLQPLYPVENLEKHDKVL